MQGAGLRVLGAAFDTQDTGINRVNGLTERGAALPLPTGTRQKLASLEDSRPSSASTSASTNPATIPAGWPRALAVEVRLAKIVPLSQ